MDFKIKEYDLQNVAYIRQTGPYGSSNKTIMEHMKKWAVDKYYMNNSSVILGVVWDDPSAVEADKCRYDVCFVIPEGTDIDTKDIMTETIPGGRYAVLTVDHTVEGVANAWSRIFPLTIEKGYTPDPSRPVIECYAVEMVAAGLCQLWLPVI